MVILFDTVNYKKILGSPVHGIPRLLRSSEFTVPIQNDPNIQLSLSDIVMYAWG